jgi:hypothetical protein
VDALYVILKMHRILEPYLIDLALESVSFFNISQMLSLKVLRQVS